MNKIIGTIFTKGLVAVINFLVVILTAQYMGSTGRGEVSIMYLNVSLILLVNDLVGGGALVYMVPKIGLKKCLLPSLCWALITSIVLTLTTNIYFQYSAQNFIWFFLNDEKPDPDPHIFLSVSFQKIIELLKSSAYTSLLLF